MKEQRRFSQVDPWPLFFGVWDFLAAAPESLEQVNRMTRGCSYTSPWAATCLSDGGRD